ncbi:MAG: PQQ-binding-like beta-propeller repeat protein [Vicinamibacteria bacterium]
MASLLLIPGVSPLPGQEPTPQRPPEEAQEAEPTQPAENAEQAAPAPPPPPEGILPVAEIARIAYTPRDRPQIMLHGNRLVVVTASGAVEGHDAQSGEFRWRLGLPGETLYPPVVLRSSPFEILLSSAAGRVFVVDAETGEIRRERELPFALALEPLPAGAHVVAATPAGEVIAFDLETGEERFRATTPEAPSALASSGKLLVASGSERTLTAIDASGGSVVWAIRGRSPFHPPAVFGGNANLDRLYVGNDSGEFYCLDVEDGDTSYRWSTGASIRHPALVEERRVYVTNYGNNLYAYHAGGGAEQWRVSLPGRPASGPVRFGLRLVVATYDGVLVEVDPERGVPVRGFTAPGELASPPAFLVAAPGPAPELGPDGAPLGPQWYELHRIALALRTGEVLLLGHQPTPPEPEKDPEKEPPPEGVLSR